MNLSGPNNTLALLPALLMAIFGCATLLLDVLFPRRGNQRQWFVWFLLAGQGLVGIALYRQWSALQSGDLGIASLAGSVRVDGWPYSRTA